MDRPRVALLGLGIMGTGMAHNLLRAGHPLTVYNRSAEKAAPLKEAGARVASSPREAVTDAEIVIAMVADDPASRTVWLGDQGALAHARKDALLIDSSTLSVGWIEELAAAARQAGVEFIDAPVTGSKEHAASAQIVFLVGGSTAAYERARPVLSVMGRAVLHIGPTGAGVLLKLVNNFMSAVQAASLAEALTVIERAGLDRDKALEVLTNGAPGSLVVKMIAPRMTSQAYTPPNFTLRLMMKDVTYARAEAARHGVTLETAEAVLSLCQRAMAEGLSEQDFSVIVESVRARAKAGQA